MKNSIFSIIWGNQIHDLCRFLIDHGWQPSFDYYPADWWSFSAYNWHSWFLFEDEKSNTPYNLTIPLDQQDDHVFQKLDLLLSTIWNQ